MQVYTHTHKHAGACTHTHTSPSIHTTMQSLQTTKPGSVVFACWCFKKFECSDSKCLFVAWLGCHSIKLPLQAMVEAWCHCCTSHNYNVLRQLFPCIDGALEQSSYQRYVSDITGNKQGLVFPVHYWRKCTHPLYWLSLDWSCKLAICSMWGEQAEQELKQSISTILKRLLCCALPHRQTSQKLSNRMATHIPAFL